MSESLRPLLRRRALGAMLLVCAMGLAAAALPAVARADRAYTVRFTQNAQGDITGTGNTLLTCRDDDARCAAARRGQASGADNNNNNLSMRYVDVDADKFDVRLECRDADAPARRACALRRAVLRRADPSRQRRQPCAERQPAQQGPPPSPEPPHVHPADGGCRGRRPGQPHRGRSAPALSGVRRRHRHCPVGRRRRVHRRRRPARHRAPSRPVGRLGAGGGIRGQRPADAQPHGL